MNTIAANPVQSPDPSKLRPVLEAARTACRRIAPLWPLRNFVAVNPFVGLADRPFIDACDLIRRIAPGGMQMPLAFYAEKSAAGEITDADLTAALASARRILTAPWAGLLATINESTLKSALKDAPFAENGGEILTVAEAVDAVHGTTWAAAVTETIAQFCSEYYDAGQSAWRLPWRGLPLYNAWREKARINLNAEMLGLRGFRQWVKTLPPDAAETVCRTMSVLGVSEADAPD